MTNSTREKAYICPNCGKPVKTFELDREFGKQRREMGCPHCEQVFDTVKAEKLYSEKDLKQMFYKQFQRTDGILSHLPRGSREFKEVLGKRKMIRDFVKILGWDMSFLQELGHVKCQNCGNLNYVGRDSCIYCNRKLEAVEEQ